ncbi:MAG: hypothetical protein SGI89_08620 [bacterium]|nr:hypothetical protein [bacterium]
MSDLIPNNPEKDSMPNSGNNDLNFELITAYIDNELDATQKDAVKKMIDNDSDYHNRYIFEKLTKENFIKRSNRIETPIYVYQNIGKGIEDYISANSGSGAQINPSLLTQQANLQKLNLRRYLSLGSVGFVVLIVAAFFLNNYLKTNPEHLENDFVSVSRNIFDKVESGEVKLQYKSDVAKTLGDSMDKFLDFKVFIPDVKDAILVGGVCNEIYGEKFAHIIHKKGNILIYTLQANKSELLGNKDKVILNDKFKEYVKAGKNWFPCMKDKNKTVVIWFKDNIICSTVAAMESQDIATTLTNYK